MYMYVNKIQNHWSKWLYSFGNLKIVYNIKFSVLRISPLELNLNFTVFKGIFTILEYACKLDFTVGHYVKSTVVAI